MENITVYSLPAVLPFYNKNRTVNRINQRRIASFIRSKMREHGFNNPILWVYHPRVLTLSTESLTAPLSMTVLTVTLGTWPY